ncbi:IPT/TIG domain-containing protein [Monashia sp. NPDC004114]
MVIVASLMALTAAFALYALWSFWPAPLAPSLAAPPPAKFTYFRWEVTLTRDQQYFVIVAVAGVIGSMLYGLRSLAKYVGERKFVKSWIPSYLLLPFIGAVIATIVYLALRAGLLPGANSASQPDAFGITAIAAMVGWFSAQAAEKMKEVFQTLFTKPDPGSDSITAPTTATMTGFSPAEGPAGTTVSITGTGLTSVKRVLFTADAEARILSQTDTTLDVEVPGDAQDGSITLDTGTSQVTSTDIFTVSPPPSDGSDSDDDDTGNIVVVNAQPGQPGAGGPPGADGPMSPQPAGGGPADGGPASGGPAGISPDDLGLVGTTDDLAAVGDLGSAGRVGSTEELEAVGSGELEPVGSATDAGEP